MTILLYQSQGGTIGQQRKNVGYLKMIYSFYCHVTNAPQSLRTVALKYNQESAITCTHETILTQFTDACRRH